MPIEGPLRELGIHDVFQLLDLSRKTGVLRVTSTLRDDEGIVGFDSGRVVLATIRSKPQGAEHAMLAAGRISERDLANATAHAAQRGGTVAEALVELGATTLKELERHLRLAVERVVFELMSWSEGYFSFEERRRDELPAGRRISVSTESLLMEGARRIDEWSRIVDTIPHAGVVPDLAPVGEDREGSQLDLLPHEWQVLTLIDGSRDLRSIASAMARDEFEIAKIAYGLVRTGVIEVRAPRRRSSGAYRRRNAETDALLESAKRHAMEGRHAAALDDLRRAAKHDSGNPAVQRALGYAAARSGDLAQAKRSWETYVQMADDDDTGVQPVHDALALLTAFTTLVEADVGR